MDYWKAPLFPERPQVSSSRQAYEFFYNGWDAGKLEMVLPAFIKIKPILIIKIFRLILKTTIIHTGAGNK